MKFEALRLDWFFQRSWCRQPAGYGWSQAMNSPPVAPCSLFLLFLFFKEGRTLP